MPARLIINADDFGLTSGINRAIANLHDTGVLSSATLMAGGPAFAEAAALARARPGLGVGCHLVFVDGTPISPPETVRSLLGPDGRTFRNNPLDFAQAVVRGIVSAQELGRETQAQIQSLQTAGITLTHVDTHKHTHILPQVAEVILHTAHHCGVHCIRNPFEPAWCQSLTHQLQPAPWMRRIQLYLVGRFETQFQRVVKREMNQATTAGTLGILGTGDLNEQLLNQLLSALKPFAAAAVFELCTHPGYLDSALESTPTRLQGSRALEHSALRNILPDLLTREGAPQLVSYADLAR